MKKVGLGVFMGQESEFDICFAVRLPDKEILIVYIVDLEIELINLLISCQIWILGISKPQSRSFNGVKWLPVKMLFNYHPDIAFA
ncbi:MAG TPA: hypothetical protein VHD33_07400 [Legionellaceae bacterium]|nr:hypothetical protein [Legionellaceae bacterium]